MSKGNILIVEDEVLIASSIKKNIVQNGYQCNGIAINTIQALKILKKERVDLVLLDVNIAGPESGIDLAKLLVRDYGLPFIYITSYRDEDTLEEIKETRPEAFLSKPIDSLNLITTLDIVFDRLKEKEYLLKVGSTSYRIDLEDLIYAKAEHVYVQLVFTHEEKLIRTSLNNLIESLPENNLLRINRSIAVNPEHITRFTKKQIEIKDQKFSVSPIYQENLKFIDVGQ